ncbi:hypothetical protein M758_3G146800 [Ceratodon purpureus]|nr:hypothetical protein M758_3G146800 [Ceratodon purpureus]
MICSIGRYKGESPESRPRRLSIACRRIFCCDCQHLREITVGLSIRGRRIGVICAGGKLGGCWVGRVNIVREIRGTFRIFSTFSYEPSIGQLSLMKKGARAAAAERLDARPTRQRQQIRRRLQTIHGVHRPPIVTEVEPIAEQRLSVDARIGGEAGELTPIHQTNEQFVGTRVRGRGGRGLGVEMDVMGQAMQVTYQLWGFSLFVRC